MPPHFMRMSGIYLVVMGIGGHRVLDMPTWLSVWNVVMGVLLIACATSNGAGEE